MRKKTLKLDNNQSLNTVDSNSPIEPTLITKPRFKKNGFGELVIEAFVDGEKLDIKEFSIHTKDTIYKVS